MVRPSIPQATRRDALRALGAGTSLVPLLAGIPFIRHARAADTQRFALGVASGQPRPHGMVLWTRLTGESLPAQVDVTWTVAADEGFTRVVARGTHRADAAWAHSVHAEPEGLTPDAWYWYRFEALGARSPTGRTRTAPLADARATLHFAIASCQRFDVAHYAAWRALSERPLDAVIFLGDYIYEGGSAPGTLRPHRGGQARTLDAYRQRYAQYKEDPLLQAAHAACPWWLVWDDHEVENDYANAQSQTLDTDFMARRAAAYQAYWEHMPFSMAQRPQGAAMRIVDRFQWGRLATLHLLDDRQYRDVQVCPRPGRGGSNTVRLADCPDLTNPRRSLLGAEQERWLADGLDRERPWNLIAQQTVLSRFSWRDPAKDPTYWTDGWDGYAPARDRLLEAIAARRLRGTVVLGGDVHTHYVNSVKRDFDNPRSATIASEFVAAGITSRSGLAQARMPTVLAHNPHVHFGRSDRRGAMVFALNDKLLEAEVLGVDDDQRPDSAVSTLARFVVDAKRPGPLGA